MSNTGTWYFVIDTLGPSANSNLRRQCFAWTHLQISEPSNEQEFFTAVVLDHLLYRTIYRHDTTNVEEVFKNFRFGKIDVATNTFYVSLIQLPSKQKRWNCE